MLNVLSGRHVRRLLAALGTLSVPPFDHHGSQLDRDAPSPAHYLVPPLRNEPDDRAQKSRSP